MNFVLKNNSRKDNAKSGKYGKKRKTYYYHMKS